MSTSFNIGGVYKSLAACQVNIGSVWKTVTGIYGNIGGVWKELYTSVIANTYELLTDTTVSGSAVTSVDFTGLNLGKSDEILLVSEIYNPSGSGCTYKIWFNGNNTDASYYSQSLYVGNTTIGAGRSADAGYVYTDINRFCCANTSIKLTNSGYIVTQSQTARSYHTTISPLEMQIFHNTSTFTATSITGIRIGGSISTAIGIGSRFQLYRIAGGA